MKEEIKELRINIDGLAQLTKSLNPMDCNTNNPGLKNNSKEIEKTYDSLILAKAWLGKVLGELGESTPYANDGSRKTVEDIEPAADTAEVVPGLREPFTGKNAREAKFNIDTWELNGRPMMDWDNFNHIERVDWLREEIKNIINEGPDASSEYPELQLEQGFIYKYLSEARFWLGFELQRIRENESKHS